MKDLTKDSITLHILAMAGPAAITMLVHAAHQVVTLHFVSAIGTDAVAGVSAAGNAGFIVGALAQILSVGTASLVAYSAGTRDLQSIGVLLNQAIGLGIVCAFIIAVILWMSAPLYMAAVANDGRVVDQGVRFLWWASPGFALLFPLTALSAAFRGMGVVGAPSVIFTLTITFDAAFAVVLIPGHGFIPALGVQGAALASTFSYVIGLILMLAYLRRAEPRIAIRRKMLIPQFAVWRRIIAVGAPAAAELTLMFLSISVVYLVIRTQGASTQAGFGVGFQVLQLLLLPGIAVAFAAAPIAGQNFGVRNASRVREVFRTTALLSTIVMLVTTTVVQWAPQTLLRLFDTEPAAAVTAIMFLQLMSWTMVAQGLVYSCAFMFQALGNTTPALLSALARFVVFSAPALWASRQPGFRTEQVWYLLTASVAVQSVVSVCLLQFEFKCKLGPALGDSPQPAITGNKLTE